MTRPKTIMQTSARITTERATAKPTVTRGG
jgi:hypothetical protein